MAANLIGKFLIESYKADRMSSYRVYYIYAYAIIVLTLFCHKQHVSHQTIKLYLLQTNVKVHNIT